MTDDAVVRWLLDGDPAVRWQVLRDLLGAPETDWAPVRALVETEGWGAQLLALQGEDGLWAGGTFAPAGFTREQWETEGQPWTGTAFVLDDLRELGLDPGSAAARRTVQLVGQHGRWFDDDAWPFWGGETEECINGRLVTTGVHFGVDMAPLVERLVGERLDDGGWNCERANGSVRSSFHSTINVLEGLLQFEAATGGTAASREARASGEAFLLERGLFRRLSTGEPADPDYLRLTHPSRWHHHVLRGLDHFRAAGRLTGAQPDVRLGDALEWLRDARTADGRWPLERRLRGRQWLELDDGVGAPSRWLTLQALRVLAWADGA